MELGLLDLSYESIKAMSGSGIYELRLDDEIGGISNIRVIFFAPPREWKCRFETPLPVVWILETIAKKRDQLQQHAKEMLRVFLDSGTEDEDRFLAASTLADILFPTVSEGDSLLGTEMQEGNELARQSPETASQLMKMDHEEEEFAVRLEEAMRQQGVDQAELARRLGIGQSAISMMMKRECRPQRRTITRRVEALSVLPDDLWPGFSTR